MSTGVKVPHAGARCDPCANASLTAAIVWRRMSIVPALLSLLLAEVVLQKALIHRLRGLDSNP
jgi:hypothetical protein